ncbi:amino acid/amide ABC transporter ATP-binding protein 2, HAAT family [Variovorax sp. HW608]|uniref:ABC transporter ATP-binding protein n=1 Tax=Variovorax sp. HW608 TaxID=1034889 RepID=UPI00081FD763|nr:ABC transporter ATP-binding protein [Variovorax sp. HW608]SCK30890.1 amino acid/amide ABC transporter ATP-binding protein 2, HAAT family [Variovorax sp. HW608]
MAEGVSGTPALSIANIEVVYNHSVQALRGLSIEVPDGKVVALLGSNGAGKTTTLKAASGILPLENGRVASGRIRFFGEDIERWAPHVLPRRGLAHVREGRHVFAELTVDENLVAAANALSGRSGGRGLDIEGVFHYFPRLKERRKQLSGYLSGGEQQMLAIARALIGQPRLILLDEPSLGLAPLVVKDIFSIIARINREQGVAMLLVEQNAKVALGVADYGYIMENGRIVINGPKDKLLGDADVQRFYLGSGESGEGQVSFREIKHYKRRKRWLS